MEKRFAAAVKVVLCGGLAFFCSFLDRLAWPPVIPLAARELGLTAAQAGGFMSAFFFGYLLTQLPGGMLADRWGTRKVLLYSLMLMGIFTTAIVWMPDFQTGLALRFLAGVGSGAVLAAAVKGVYDYFEPAKRATAMGFFMASGPLGLLTANLLSPFLAAAYGWRTSFLVAGVFTLIVGLLSWQLLPQRSQLQLVPQPGKSSQGLSDLWRNRDLMLTAAAGFFAMWGTWGTLTWANAYMSQSLGLTLSQSGQLMAVFGLGALAGQPLAGWLADRYMRRRRQTGMIILAAFALLLWLFGQNRDVSLLTALIPLLGAGAFVFGPVLNTFISELVAPRQVATAIGLCNGIWQLGSLISPVTAGVILDRTGSYSWAFTVLAAGPLLAVAILALVRTSGIQVGKEKETR